MEKKGFDYKEYLAEGWLFKEDKRKQILQEAIRDSRNDSQEVKQNKRKSRQLDGNWEGSIGEFFENYCDTLGSEYQAGTLRQFCEDVMIPNLNPSAQEDCRQLMDTCKSDQRLLDAFKNFYLAGIGLPGERAHGLRGFKMPKKKHLEEISAQTAMNAASKASDRGQSIRSQSFRKYATDSMGDDSVYSVDSNEIRYTDCFGEKVRITYAGSMMIGSYSKGISVHLAPGNVGDSSGKVENRKTARIIANWCANNLEDSVKYKDRASDWHNWAKM